MVGLAEQLNFEENPIFEQLIEDILSDGYSVLDNFFPQETITGLRKDLLDKYEEDYFKKAAIGNRTNEVIKTEIRGDFILWMDEANLNPTQTGFFGKINELSAYLNKTCFLGILRKEFHYAVYPAGKFYRRHLDTFQNDDCRRLSVVCYLNENNWLPEHGGELVLYLNDENGKEYPKAVFPMPGRTVIFESQRIEHEVKPANRQRLSITGWLKTR
jgi:SM-20-related protein